MVSQKLRLSKESESFLNKGKLNADRALEIIRECDLHIRKFAQSDLARALPLANKLVHHSRHLSGELLSVSLRTLGWVLLLCGSFKDSEKAYLEARDLASDDASVRARIDRILIDIYMHLGDIRETRKRARNAIRTFRRLGDFDGEAKARINHANSYHRQDRHSDALRIYQKAIAHYEKSDDKLTLGSCYYNCANSYVQLLDFDKAEDYYKSAERVFNKIGYDLYVNESQYGRAWLNKLRGNYHLSLRGLSECERYYRHVGQPKGVMLCQLDRAEVMLELRLVSDARTLAKEAEQGARKLDLWYEASKAALFLAKAAVSLGLRPEAKQALDRAKRGFKKVDNTNMLAVTQFYEELYLKRAHRESDFRRVRKVLSKTQLPLWQAICDLNQLAVSGDHDQKQCVNRLKKNRAVQVVPQLYASWQTMLGDIAIQSGDKAIAKQYWKRAANTLDQMRVNLPLVDMRQSLSEQDLDPHKRMLNSMLAESPEDAAIWSERSKVAGIWTQPEETLVREDRRQVRDKLALLAQEVTALSVSLERTRGQASRQQWQSHNSYQRLQSQIRRNMLAFDGTMGGSVSTQSEVRRLIHKLSDINPIVQFHSEDNRLLAFVHFRGETRVHKYDQGNEAISRFLGQWNILLGEMLTRGKNVRQADRDEERRLLEQLGDWLWSPLEISISNRQVYVIPAGRMTCLPWSAMLVNGSPLIDRHTFSLAPSIRHLRKSISGSIKSTSATVFVGDTTRLKTTHEEISSVSKLNGVQTTVLSPCRREDWPVSDSALLWHFIGHAQFRGDNPFYSSLSLADGPLFAADFRLQSNRVALVTLAACRTGVQSSLPNYESTGLVRSLIEMGAKNVVASHWPVSDRATTDWMREFYNQLNNSISLSESVQKATQEMSAVYPCAGQWAAFSLFGSGQGFQIENK